jgi:hypothetical protein
MTDTMTMTDMVTVTEVSTMIQPTTFTSVWVKTQVIDNVRTTDFESVYFVLITNTDSDRGEHCDVHLH